MWMQFLFEELKVFWSQTVVMAAHFCDYPEITELYSFNGYISLDVKLYLSKAVFKKKKKAVDEFYSR